MRHPFDGINLAGPEDSLRAEPIEPRTSRRSALRRAFGAAAGVLAALSGRMASAQSYRYRPRGRPTTLALGEEGGSSPWPQRPPAGQPGGGTWGRRGATTFALGEEGGGHTPTTFALGEEGGYPPQRPPGGGVVTTYAVGEEGGSPPRVTTFALGEEG
jgi:hypothetical protein